MLISMFIKMQLELITIASAGVNISVRCLIFFIYFKLKNIFQRIKMNAEELLQDLPKDTAQDVALEQQYAKTERLSANLAGGGSKQYLGRELRL